MIWVTRRAGSASPGVAGRKSGTAIGTGCTLPWVTSSRSTARAGDTRKPVNAAAAPPVIRIPRRLIAFFLFIEILPWRIKEIPRYRISAAVSAAEHLARIEIHLDILPRLVFRRRQEAEGRAFADGAHRAFRRHLEYRLRAAIDHRRVARQRTVFLELNANRHDEVARITHADRHVPAIAQARAPRGALVQRGRHGGTGGGPGRGGVVERGAERGLALRRALVEQGEAALDLGRVVFLLLALPGFLAFPGLLPLLRLLELLGFLFSLRLLALERLRDGVDDRLGLVRVCLGPRPPWARGALGPAPWR